jgi:hypothetical protein
MLIILKSYITDVNILGGNGETVWHMVSLSDRMWPEVSVRWSIISMHDLVYQASTITRTVTVPVHFELVLIHRIKAEPIQFKSVLFQTKR